MAPGRSDARLNRSRVLEAARELFAEDGGSVEMKEIAERAGVGIGTLYRNFETKGDLVSAIINEAVTSLQETVERAAASEDVREGIRLCISGVCEIIEQSGIVMRLLLEGAMPGSFEHPDLGDVGLRIDELMERGVRTGVFRADLDPRIAAANLKGLMFPIPYLHLRAQLSMEEIVAGYTDLVFRGVLAQPV